jgi:hypothetical protein
MCNSVDVITEAFVRVLSLTPFLYAYHCRRFCRPGTLDPSKASGKIVACVREGEITSNTLTSGVLFGTYSSFIR